MTLLSETLIRHFDNHTKQETVTENFISKPATAGSAVTVLLTCGASCPDAVVEGILLRLVSFFPNARPISDVMMDYKA